MLHFFTDLEISTLHFFKLNTGTAVPFNSWTKSSPKSKMWMEFVFVILDGRKMTLSTAHLVAIESYLLYLF